MIYYGLDMDGRLYNLGDHRSLEAANADAAAKGRQLVWIIPDDMKHHWVKTLTNRSDDDG